jgi:mono/diheme cytochrome c family protein
MIAARRRTRVDLTDDATKGTEEKAVRRSMVRIVVATLVLVLGAESAGCGGRDKTTGTSMTPTALTADPERGKQVFLDHACWQCHTIKKLEGQTPRPMRNIGPRLDLVGRTYDAAFIRRSITEPAAYTEKGESGSIGGTVEYRTRMPTFGPEQGPPYHMSEQQLADLVDFIVESGRD